jgi:hypothetical protein
MFTMTKDERDLYEMQAQLNALKVELYNADKWIERARDNMENLQEMIFEMQERVYATK